MRPGRRPPRRSAASIRISNGDVSMHTYLCSDVRIIVWMWIRHHIPADALEWRFLVIVVTGRHISSIDDERLLVTRFTLLRDMQSLRIITVSHAIITLRQQNQMENQRKVTEGRHSAAGHLAETASSIRARGVLYVDCGSLVIAGPTPNERMYTTHAPNDLQSPLAIPLKMHPLRLNFLTRRKIWDFLVLVIFILIRF